jgi:RNA-binding protein
MTSSRPPRTAARKAAAKSPSGPRTAKKSGARKGAAKPAPRKASAARPKPRAPIPISLAPVDVDGVATLSPAERQVLKARAHGSPAVAMIGSKGLTDAVIAEVEIQLALHGLIKVKAASDEREERETWLMQLCERLGAAPVQHIGKMLLLYRPKAPEPVPEPAPKKVRPKDKPTPQERRMEAAGVSPNVGRARLGVKKTPGYKSYDGRKTRRDDGQWATGGQRDQRRAPPRTKSEDAAGNTVARPPSARTPMNRTPRTGEGTTRSTAARTTRTGEGTARSTVARPPSTRTPINRTLRTGEGTARSTVARTTRTGEGTARNTVARPTSARTPMTRTVRTGEGTARTVTTRPRAGEPAPSAQMRRRRPTTPKD